MKAVFGLVLLIGMGLAGFAVYMVKGYMDTQSAQLARMQQRAAQAVATVEIYAPTRALTYGDLLTAEDVALVTYARDTLPEGVFQTEEELFPAGLDTPRVVVLPMQINEPIMANKVTEPGASRGLTALVEPGMRAFPIAGRVASGFGALRPNDRIDVYWTGQLRNGAEVTNLLKSGLQIIAVIGDQESRGAPQNVVVQVTPQEVALLTQAANSGALTLSLVGAGDVETVGAIQVDNMQITGEQAVEVQSAPEPAPEEQKCYVIQRSGTERVQVEIECSN
ncbi:Flp pilus assembly protein CpaB [Yoonia sp.]|uniref:Flp pilus assembly protein CpaB n=1 Tax=Yoonia sp. TaxID=2212373 RepID=UPI0019F74B67|nr:Flp pilus assembly protein CpaB [Yoonia sp.]MBE0413520.1 Flp pilus assembly protein CpaB [Yoonia sp.]